MNPLQTLEQAVLTEGREWSRRRLEAQAQKEVDQWATRCPVNGELLTYRKRQRLKLDTCAGQIVVKTWRGYSWALGRWVNPTRHRWGLQPRQRLSPELQSRLGFTATVTGSYEQAARTATRWGSPVSDDAIHACVQQLGRRAGDLVLPTPVTNTQEPEFSMVIMMDGWMVRQRGIDWGVSRRRKKAVRVSWKEVKAAVIYRLEKRVQKESGRGMLLEKYVVASPPDTDPIDFGAQVQAEARRRGLGQARKVYVVIDGAVWLWNVAQDRFSNATCLLDFHHASQHLWAIAHQLHGEGSTQAREWVEPLLGKLRHGNEEKVVQTLEALLQKSSGLSSKTRRALQTPVAYFQSHREHLRYQHVERQGGPIASGSVESLNSQLQNRFKRTGQFWDNRCLPHLMLLDVLLRNNDYDLLWN
jgi:hypothetical protein